VKKSKQVVSLLLVLIMAIGMTFTTGCSKKSDPSNTLVVTVGDHKVFMDEVMYYIFNVEATGAYYDQSYQQYYGKSYWDMEAEGQTMRDKTKQYVMDTVVMYEILYEKALAEGFTCFAFSLTPAG
jgi:foldase protein PrsA